MSIAYMSMAPTAKRVIEHILAIKEGENACAALIAQTSFALAHTDACREVLKAGSRQVHMWGFTENMMMRGGALADYGEVKKLSIRLAEYLSNGKKAHLTTPDGTDIEISSSLLSAPIPNAGQEPPAVRRNTCTEVYTWRLVTTSL